MNRTLLTIFSVKNLIVFLLSFTITIIVLYVIFEKSDIQKKEIHDKQCIEMYKEYVKMNSNDYRKYVPKSCDALLIKVNHWEVE